MPSLPDPDALHPIALRDGSPHLGTVHLSRAIDHPNIHVGDWSYYSAIDPPSDPDGWAAMLAPYLYPGAPDHLHIGRFCQIASGVRIVTASANHATGGISTYPFPVFDPAAMRGYTPDARDTIIGNDVWIGMGATISPAAQIGDGAIIATGAVVRGRVPPYAVMAGNPARLLRMRFDQGDVDRLLDLKWWAWPRDRIEAATEALQACDIDSLAHFAP